MNFRLTQPSILIDLNNIPELFYIHRDQNGGLLIGAMTRESAVEYDALIKERAPLVCETMPHIAHPQIRNRGTYGGCLAHADPAAELPAVTVALKGRIRVRNQGGERWILAQEFFTGLFATALEPDEMVVEIALPPMPARTGWCFREVSRRHGDYALVGVAALVTLDNNGKCEQARMVFLSVGDGPMVGNQAANLLKGQPLTTVSIQEAAELAAKKDVDPSNDIHASADYRRHLVSVLARQALNQAYKRAKEIGGLR